MKEGSTFDRKSLRTVIGKTSDFPELARDCVAFANLRGGELHIGIEDDEKLPPCDQIIPEELPAKIIKRINELTYNVYVTTVVNTAENGGEYIILRVYNAASSIASTTKGEFLLRDGDASRPITPDELSRLLTDKPSFCWETKVVSKIRWEDCDRTKLSNFVYDIRNSDPRRVSEFIKNKSEFELLEYYLMVDQDGYLTNLGVLWIGKREQRARLMYAPAIQYIRYDSDGKKTFKEVWDDYSLNPKELIEAVWNYIPEWKESYEVSEGLWRKQISVYDEKVVREVLCNALAHRPYTTRGDIFINIYPDRMEVINPGLLPIGVTVSNILQKTIQRNDHLSRVFFALQLIEKEGSGWDLMYETLLSSGKEVPKPYEGDDSVKVVIKRNVISNETVRMFEYINDHYTISQKGLIAFGIIIQAKKIKVSELSAKLQLPQDERLRTYVKSLLDNEIIIATGRGKGVWYSVNPKLFFAAKSNSPTTLKTIEPYRLKALIIEDLRHHPDSLISEISKRLPDVEYADLERIVREMAHKEEITYQGGRKFRRYQNI